jgi:hypothetical protein
MIGGLDVANLTHEERDSFADAWKPQTGHRKQISGDGTIKRRCRGRQTGQNLAGK